MSILTKVNLWWKKRTHTHNYEIYEVGTTIYRCSECDEFKIGEAQDADGYEIFVFKDGSYFTSKSFEGRT
jgi:hypothetical protein